MFGALALRDMLERKYAIMQQEANARSADAASSGLLRQAQAGLVRTQTDTLPDQVAAEIAARQADTNTLNAALPSVGIRAAADARLAGFNADLTGKEVGAFDEKNRLGLGLLRAQTTDTLARAGQTNTESSILRRSSLTPASRGFGIRRPSILGSGGYSTDQFYRDMRGLPEY